MSTPKPNRPNVFIPKSDLRVRIDRAEAIKAEMTEMLRQLEQTATGQPIEKPGSWRHRPLDYLKPNFDKKQQ